MTSFSATVSYSLSSNGIALHHRVTIGDDIPRQICPVESTSPPLPTPLKYITGPQRLIQHFEIGDSRSICVFRFLHLANRLERQNRSFPPKAELFRAWEAH